MRVKLKKLKRSKRVPKLQLSLLGEDEDLKNKYRISVKNKFGVLETLTTAEERWQKMKESIEEAAREHIPLIERKANKKWMTTEILVLMEDRRKVKQDEQKFSEICKLIKKKCNEAKERWIIDQCIEIEKQTVKDSKYIHKKIKEVTWKNPSSRIGCLKSKDGQILMGKNEILHRWSEYIEGVYNDERCPTPPISNGTEGSPILVEEVEHALEKMKKGKAAGPDDVPIELITALQDIGIMEVTKLLNIIYTQVKYLMT